jgi:hypothetical protein
MPAHPSRSVLLLVVTGAVGLLGPQRVQAQTKADSVARRDSLARTLAPFAIRATRSTQSSFTAPLAITHIDKSQYAGKSGFGLNDALGNVPGVLVQSRYGTSDIRIAIRGFGARGAGDRSNAGTSRGVRVLLDGMPETEPDGRTSFDNIDLAAAEGLRSDQGADAGAVQRFQLPVSVIAPQPVGIGMRGADLSVTGAGMGDAGIEGDGHGMVSHQAAHQRLRLFRHIGNSAQQNRLANAP